MPAWLDGSLTMRDFPVRRKVSWSSAVLQKLLPEPLPSMAPSLTDHFESHIQPIRVLPSKISFDPGRTRGGESSGLPGPRPPRPPPAPPAGGAASPGPASGWTGAPPVPAPPPPVPPPLDPATPPVPPGFPPVAGGEDFPPAPPVAAPPSPPWPPSPLSPPLRAGGDEPHPPRTRAPNEPLARMDRTRVRRGDECAMTPIVGGAGAPL